MSPARERIGSRRREVLDVLRTVSGPLGVAEVAERLGVHPNTVRFHLEALVGEGLVEPEGLEPSGPGRPRTVYAPRAGMDRGGTRRYQMLAQALLGQLASAGPDARFTVVEAGEAWGRSLAGQSPLPSGKAGKAGKAGQAGQDGQSAHSGRADAGEAAARLVGLLDDLGFDPAVSTSEGAGGETPSLIRLRHCPFLELAEEQGQLVCPLHLSLMQGALAEMRAPLTVTDLEPFAEPDACLAHLAPTRK
ncbi:helix-turn-helix transcriptional regulator [Streptomyces sp. NPDC057616]|uniref:helix-turn-helix transcriptional regulator n=1 Tax=Streptomyces sp. NPDC057616 TaxID=3346183 RepID=UPI003691A38C